MEFTLTFLKIFAWSIYLVSPLLIFLILIVISLGQIVTLIEKWGRFNGFYWSLITATTVGYGDIRPLKNLSKILSIVIALIGIMFTGIIIAVTLKATEVSLSKHIDQSVIERIKRDLN
jgi:voltage-gated potassium channel Kch